MLPTHSGVPSGAGAHTAHCRDGTRSAAPLHCRRTLHAALQAPGHWKPPPSVPKLQGQRQPHGDCPVLCRATRFGAVRGHQLPCPLLPWLGSGTPASLRAPKSESATSATAPRLRPVLATPTAPLRTLHPACGMGGCSSGITPVRCHTAAAKLSAELLLAPASGRPSTSGASGTVCPMPASCQPAAHSPSVPALAHGQAAAGMEVGSSSLGRREGSSASGDGAMAPKPSSVLLPHPTNILPAREQTFPPC